MNIESIAIKENAFETFRREVRDGKYVVIMYGAGSFCEYFMLPALIEAGVIPKAICDGNQQRVGQPFFFEKETQTYRYRIEELRNVIQRYKKVKAIVGSAEYAYEIKKSLMEFLSGEDIYDNFFCYELIQYIDDFRRYLYEHRMRFMDLYNVLEDEKSKYALENVLNGRVTFDYAYFETIYETDQYFPKDVIGLSDNEVFVDAGAYDGDTLRVFLEQTQGQFNKYYAFEPNEELYDHLVDHSGEDERIVCVKKAVGRDEKEMFLLDKATGSGYVMAEVEHDTTAVQVIDLDELDLGDITFVKMDIEGAEMDAVIGATKLIKKCRPKLAICIYHKYTDLLEIAEYIRLLNLDYKFYIRHHSKIFSETVLYAI